MTDSSSLPHAADPDAIAMRLIQRAHNRDGLPEIAVGLIFLVVSGLTYAQLVLARGSVGFIVAVLTGALLVPLLILGSPWILKRVRRRYLTPRVGYVEARPTSRKQIVTGVTVAAAVSLLALILVITRLFPPDPWILAGTGVGGGALLAWCGRLPRFLILGLLMAAAGVSVALSGVSLEAGFSILFGFLGLMTLVSGGVIFLRLIRQPIEAGD